MAASAISGHFDTRTAATEVADLLFDELGSPSARDACDLLLLFGSFHHRAAFDEAAAIIRRTIMPRSLLGVTAEAVLGSDRELEGVAGLSAIALRLPGVRLHPWSATPEHALSLENAEALRQQVGIEPQTRALIMVGDPFTTAITKLLPAIASCGINGQKVPIIGGMASGASQPGLNVLVLDEQVHSAGAIGITLSGDLDIDFVVSQGCRPVGTPFVITKCRDNVMLELGGRKAIDTLQEMAQSLPDAEKRLLSRGLLMGTVVNEYKDRFGRGDFLVRNLMGFDQKVGGIVAGETCRVGQTIQFHVRDAAIAGEDLQLLLDAQVLNPVSPFAALLFSCNGRGERLFGQPNHDLNIIRERLSNPNLPIAGFFAAGEFGPIGNQSYLHGHTASLAILRGKPSG